MTGYIVLLSGDESAWEKATPQEQADVFAKHEEFSRVLAERGHKVVGGEQLAPSHTAKSVSKDSAGKVVVTDGPYAEMVEQLGAYYLIESDDLADLVQICGILAQSGDGIEVRELLREGGEGPS